MWRDGRALSKKKKRHVFFGVGRDGSSLVYVHHRDWTSRRTRFRFPVHVF